MSQAGWYPDPNAPHQNRYYDGASWTEHVQPGAPVQPVQHTAMYAQSTTVVVAQPQKSVGVALLLTFFFGPLGMLYSTILGGVVMFLLDIVLGFVTLGLWFIVAWPLQMVWAAVAASNSAKSTGVVQQGFVGQAPYQPQYQPQPQYQLQPQQYQPQPQVYAPVQPAALPPAAPYAADQYGAVNHYGAANPYPSAIPTNAQDALPAVPPAQPWGTPNQF